MTKTKEQINREDLTYSMLRKVIIRADFTPMLDLDAMVSDINSKEWFQGKFNNYNAPQISDSKLNQKKYNFAV